jgi:hypothetical protein
MTIVEIIGGMLRAGTSGHAKGEARQRALRPPNIVTGYVA